jgi:cystathionine beta-synthase
LHPRGIGRRSGDASDRTTVVPRSWDDGPHDLPEGAPMEVLDTFLDAMGDTPLVRLRNVTRGVRPTVLAKLEMLNPGGSVKDRIGVRMIEAAERTGALKAGGTIVEPTSGNTGHGLAIAAAIRGYRCIFVMPDKMSQEKISLLRAYGAEVIICPTAVAPDSPESYYRVADRLTEEIPGAFQPNQYWNPENPQTHYDTTGPEIWRQTDGKVDVFVAGVGTGGTISGVGKFLKERKRDVLIVGADPEGSIYSGDEPRPYLVEGVGEDFMPGTFDPTVVDRFVRIGDRDSFRMARAVTRQEGILVGGSCGTAVAAALEVAREIDDPDATIVVLLPDSGRQYLSKIYSDPWMLQYGMLDRPDVIRVDEVLASKGRDLPPLITVRAHDKVRQAVEVLQRHSISQAPVVREASTEVSQIVGSIRDRELLERVFRDPDALQADVAEVMAPPIPVVEWDDAVDAAFAELERASATIVSKDGQVVGVLTRADLLDFLAHRRAS